MTPRRLARSGSLLLASACPWVAATLVPTHTAHAATDVEFAGRVTPVIRTVPKRPLPVTLRIVLRIAGDQPGGLPPTLDRSVIRFPYGSQLNSRLFPGCDPEALNRRGLAACPPGSRIGGGFAIGVGDTVRQRLTVTLFNGPGGRSIIFHLRGTNPLRVNMGFAAPLKTLRGGRYNYRLSVDVPRNLQVIAGVPIALTEFVSTVRATRRVGGRRRGYIEAYSCPPGAQVPLHGTFAFLEAPGVTTSSWIRCG